MDRATSPLSVSVCIPTHNRQAELATTLAQLQRLDPPPEEIVILADGCTDGTIDFVRANYPAARLLVNAAPVGCVAGRNQLFAAAAHEIILNLDDDSYPLDREIVARLRVLFQNPRLAVASFAQRTNEFPETLEAADLGPSGFPGSYVNCASAVRRSTFLELCGYTDFFFHNYDEPDYAVRCLEAGWLIYHDASLTVRHHFTPTQRNELRNHQRQARNEFWSVLLRCPAPWCVGIALFRVVRQMGYAWKRGLDWVWQEPRWWAAALAGLPQCAARRRPVSWRTYWGWMRLIRRPARTEEEWRRVLGRPEEKSHADLV